MKRREYLALGAILLSAGVIFVPSKAWPRLFSEAGYQAGQNQRGSWRPAIPKMGLQAKPSCRRYCRHSAPATRVPDQIWHRFSLVSPPVVEYWLTAARHAKVCWQAFNAGGQCSECL